jgi:hypothetical protein
MSSPCRQMYSRCSISLSRRSLQGFRHGFTASPPRSTRSIAASSFRHSRGFGSARELGVPDCRKSETSCSLRMSTLGTVRAHAAANNARWMHGRFLRVNDFERPLAIFSAQVYRRLSSYWRAASMQSGSRAWGLILAVGDGTRLESLTTPHGGARFVSSPETSISLPPVVGWRAAT